jgi:hypothetical protein
MGGSRGPALVSEPIASADIGIKAEQIEVTLVRDRICLYRPDPVRPIVEIIRQWDALMTIDPIRVMISSRCKDYVTADGTSFLLAQLRKDVCADINETKLFGQAIFQCWINENEPAKPADRDLWDECMRNVRRAHVVIVFFNGDAGWTGVDTDIGICHAELDAALLTGRERTYVIQLPLSTKPARAGSKQRNDRFCTFISQEQLFTGEPVQQLEHAKELVRQTLAEAVASMARTGALQTRKDSYALGQALEWSKLDYAHRKQAMEAECSAYLSERFGDGNFTSQANGSLCATIGKAHVLLRVHAVPAAFSIAAAREMVGRPFLEDYRYFDANGACGPVHIIACQKTATEKQATDLLGFPDAIVVTTTFGVYAADPIQKIQLVLLAGCRDATTTRYALQRFFDWLARSGEGELLVRRAVSRRAIVAAILQERENASA